MKYVTLIIRLAFTGIVCCTTILTASSRRSSLNQKQKNSPAPLMQQEKSGLGKSSLRLSLRNKLRKKPNSVLPPKPFIEPSPEENKKALNNELYKACTSGNYAAIEGLLAQGADPNTQDPIGNSLLDLLIYRNVTKLDPFKMLIDNGAKIEDINPFLFDEHSPENNVTRCETFFEMLIDYYKNNDTELTEKIQKVYLDIMTRIHNHQKAMLPLEKNPYGVFKDCYPAPTKINDDILPSDNSSKPDNEMQPRKTKKPYGVFMDCHPAPEQTQNNIFSPPTNPDYDLDLESPFPPPYQHLYPSPEEEGEEDAPPSYDQFLQEKEAKE